MTLDFFKDILFDVINESDELNIAEIDADEREDIFLITMADKSAFEIKVSRHNSPANRQE